MTRARAVRQGGRKITRRRAGVLVATLVAFLLGASPVAAAAQAKVGTRSWAEMTTGSELEQYLRVIQVAGASPLTQVSLRGWSAVERDSIVPRDSAHPWSSWMAGPARSGGISLQPIRPQVQLFENTGWPFGSNDGAIWQGRGLTTAISGGFELRAGPLTVVIDPVAFRAENQSFPLQPVPANTRGAPFNDPVSPGNIDLPQRFGNGPYQRLDPGQSTIRLDLFGATVGVSTANEIWGPAITSPIILGDNAAGIPRAFFGTSRPVNIGIGWIHARMFLGQTQQSAWSPIDTTGGKRLAAGLVAVFEPRWLPGVEIGASRYFHRFWPANGLSLSDLSIPLAGFLTHGVDPGASATGTQDNQLFSLFGRITLPRSGLELYGEYGREDHSDDLRDLIGEPDQSGAYTVGLMRTWAGNPAQAVTDLRIEVTNSRVTDIVSGRDQALFYQHGQIDQGHTQDGQLLGSIAVRGGGGATLAVDRYTQEGRMTVTFTRTDEATNTEGGLGTGAVQSLTLDALRFRRGFDLSGQLGLVYDAGVTGATDRFQLHAAVGARFPFGF